MLYYKKITDVTRRLGLMKNDPVHLSPFPLLVLLGLGGIQDARIENEQLPEGIFSVALEPHGVIGLLRLAGSKQFLLDVIALIGQTNEPITQGYMMLLDDRAEEIEFILVHPYSESFLTQMDSVNASNWEIWRTKEKILQCTHKLLRVSEQRVRRKLIGIRLAFSHTTLIGNHSNLTNPLVSYYNWIRDNTQTYFIRSQSDLKVVGTWPSLFKGNPVLNPSDASPQWIEKGYCSKLGGKAEVTWLSYWEESDSPPKTYFNPVRLEGRLSRNEPWHGLTSCIQRLEGVTAAELLWHIQKIGSLHLNLIPKLETLTGYIIYQAFQALTEFRHVGESVHRLKSKMRPYPGYNSLN